MPYYNQQTYHAHNLQVNDHEYKLSYVTLTSYIEPPCKTVMYVPAWAVEAAQLSATIVAKFRRQR